MLSCGRPDVDFDGGAVVDASDDDSGCSDIIDGTEEAAGAANGW